MSELPGAGELVVLPAGREAAKFKVHKQVRTFNSRLLRLQTGQQNSKNRRQKNVRAGQRNVFLFFARIGRSDLTRKLEKVGPFECDELEKHCRVGAKCYPTRVPALYTMTKEKCKSVLLGLLLVSR